jgi:hypothetical protein
MMDIDELFAGLRDWDVGKPRYEGAQSPYAVHLEFDDVEAIKRWAALLLDRMPDNTEAQP